jgi:hypothetical protein
MHVGGVGLDDLDVGGVDAQRVGRDLREHGIGALTDFGARRQHADDALARRFDCHG